MRCWQSIVAMPSVAAEGDERGERDLRGVGAAGEHRFAEEHPAERDAVEAAGELAVDPGLDAVHVAGVVPGDVRVDHLGHDPGAATGPRAARWRRPRSRGGVRCRSAPRSRPSRSRPRIVLRSERASRNSAGSSTMRGSGDHQSTGWPTLYQGKMPLRIGLGEARRPELAAGGDQAGRLARRAERAARRRAGDRPARAARESRCDERRAPGFTPSPRPASSASARRRFAPRRSRRGSRPRSRPGCCCRCRGRSGRAAARSRRR